MEKDIEFIKKQALSFIREQFKDDNLAYLDIKDVDLLTTTALKIEKANLDSKTATSLEDTLQSLRLKYDIKNHNSLPSLDKTNFIDIEVIPE